MKIAIGADHGGFALKETAITLLESLGHQTKDIGTFSTESVDYPLQAEEVCNLVKNEDCEMGILICGTGIGMSMAANRFNGIRAALCSGIFTAEMSRKHNNSNVLCLGARVTGEGLAMEIIKTWLKTPFESGRHQRRVCMFDNN